MDTSYLSEANLKKANLSGSNLRYADLSDAKAPHANLSWCLLEHVNLSGADLSHSNLSSSSLRKADLSNSVLIHADLSLANLEGANLTNADLRNTELYGANLSGANIFNADFRGAKLYGINLRNVKNLRYAKFDKVIFEEIKGDKLAKEGKFNEAIESYNRAIDVYLLLKKLFTEHGIYDRASIYSIGEWRVRGKIQRIAYRALTSHHIGNFLPITVKFKKRWVAFLEGHLRWLVNRILYLTSSYGESPFRVLLTTMFVIFLMALLDSKCCQGGARSFLENLYFSVVTFTTVGYGDYQNPNITFWP